MKICFVSSELLGAHKNGGIGTATSHLAVLLARRSHRVEILSTGVDPLDVTHPWARHYAACGIDLMRIDGPRPHVMPRWLRESSTIFEYLRTKRHDVIVFQDWLGHGHACTLAKAAGLAFQDTRLVIIAHGPTEWLIEANRTHVDDRSTLAQIHMERTAFARADAVVSPSSYLLDWMRAHDYTLPENTTVLPLYLWSDADLGAERRRGASLTDVSRIAFFGRLEERKGIRLFLDALYAAKQSFDGWEILFLGKPATLSPAEIEAEVAQRRPDLGPCLRFLTNLGSDEAQDVLVDQACLAVMPSLVDNSPCVVVECIKRGIPFLAARTGGIPELIHAADHERVLFAPTAPALAARLDQVVGCAFSQARPSGRKDDIERRWLGWLNGLAAAPKTVTRDRRVRKPTAEPVLEVAVIVTHYERPALLEQNLAGLASQSRTNFEVVLVDDGSRSSEAVLYLEEIERRNWPFHLRVIRQANAYLGAARNAGLRATTADRVIFMDDDNIAFPTMVETFDEAMTNLDADIVTCQMQIFEDPVGEPRLDLLQAGERWAFTGGPSELGVSINCFGDATGIYRRSVFDRVGLFHERYGVTHEDWDLHARAALAGLRGISLPVALFWYRRSRAGMFFTTDQHENMKVIWETYRRHLSPNLRHFSDLSIRTGGFEP